MAAQTPPLPFQRGKSKVFYQSEGDTTCLSGPSNGKVTMFKVSRISSSPDEEDLPDQYIGNASPRRSPSHKSQDSGFSDSGGESGSGSCGGSFYRLRKKDPKESILKDNAQKNVMTSAKPSKSCSDGLASGGLPVGCHNKRIPYPQMADFGVSDEQDDDKGRIEFKPCLKLDDNTHKIMAEGGAVKESDKSQKLCGDKVLKWHLKESVKCFYGGLAAPLTCWLQDIRVMTELECNNMLQNKAIAKDVSHLIAMGIRNTRDNFRALRARFQITQVKLDKIIRKIEQNKARHLWHDVQRLQNEVTCLLRDSSSTATPGSEESELRDQQVLLLRNIKQLMDNFKNVDRSLSNSSEVLEVVLKMKTNFNNLMKTVLSQKMKIILDAVESPQDKFCLKVAIACLSRLALDSEENCKLISEFGGLRSLLSICIDLKYSDLKIEALRSLATVCCIIEAIGQLAEIGGVEVVTDILCDAKSSKLEKAEAAGVIAQITSPWIEHNHFIRGLSENLVDLIRSITELARNTTSEEEFLLVVAALANITFLDTKACFCLKNFNTPVILIDACRRRKLAESVFIKDQIATILANLVAVADCRNSVTDCDGVVLLLCFLQIRPNMVQTEAEIDACERVQQKSAIALSRLCTDENIAKEVIRLQGVDRLVQLCKDERERNQSDAVLVACLAALRKIATSCNIDDLKEAKELIEPRLLDSFLMCSSKQESFV